MLSIKVSLGNDKIQVMALFSYMMVLLLEFDYFLYCRLERADSKPFVLVPYLI